MIYIYIYIQITNIYTYISRTKNIYYILYPYIIICTSCKLPKYFPYTPYKLDIKHLQLHKHCPCRPVVVVVVVGCLLFVVCCLLFAVCCLLFVVVVVVVVGNPPRPQKGGNHLVGGWSQGGGLWWSLLIHIYIYILVGGLEHFPIYWDFHHPNWLSYFSEEWLNHQPIYICIWFI